jgi:hypothetical protein
LKKTPSTSSYGRQWCGDQLRTHALRADFGLRRLDAALDASGFPESVMRVQTRTDAIYRRNQKKKSGVRPPQSKGSV